MEKIITRPQTCDMGSGYGEITFNENDTLQDFFNFFVKEIKSWGVMTVYAPNKEIMRKFDYNLYNDKQFYQHISGWALSDKIDKITFDYCFMNENYYVYLKR